MPKHRGRDVSQILEDQVRHGRHSRDYNKNKQKLHRSLKPWFRALTKQEHVLSAQRRYGISAVNICLALISTRLHLHTDSFQSDQLAALEDVQDAVTFPPSCFNWVDHRPTGCQIPYQRAEAWDERELKIQRSADSSSFMLEISLKTKLWAPSWCHSLSLQLTSTCRAQNESLRKWTHTAEGEYQQQLHLTLTTFMQHWILKCSIARNRTKPHEETCRFHRIKWKGVGLACPKSGVGLYETFSQILWF